MINAQHNNLETTCNTHTKVTTQPQTTNTRRKSNVSTECVLSKLVTKTSNNNRLQLQPLLPTNNQPPGVLTTSSTVNRVTLFKFFWKSATYTRRCIHCSSHAYVYKELVQACRSQPGYNKTRKDKAQSQKHMILLETWTNRTLQVQSGHISMQPTTCYMTVVNSSLH